MRKIISIVGTRPEFIKLAAINPFLKKDFEHKIIHTSQHYSRNMSDIFYNELGLYADWKLQIGKLTQGAQVARIIERAGEILQKEKPSLVLVYGDTNSTLAGAIAASKLHLKIAHVESGMRSFDKSMPEEINRIICDHIADLLFCSSKFSVDCLKKEGITKNVFYTGDINYDIFLNTHLDEHILGRLKIKPQSYFLLTIHREENTNDETRLIKILLAVNRLDKVVLFPAHPRTTTVIDKLDIKLTNIKVIEPQNFKGMLALQKNARAIITDSGGIQKEAYWLSVPCITIRSTTEWIETVQNNWNYLVDTNAKLLTNAINSIATIKKGGKHPQLYGNGHAAKKISKIIAQQI